MDGGDSVGLVLFSGIATAGQRSAIAQIDTVARSLSKIWIPVWCITEDPITLRSNEIEFNRRPMMNFRFLQLGKSVGSCLILQGLLLLLISSILKVDPLQPAHYNSTSFFWENWDVDQPQPIPQMP
nr:hypothetical protein DOP62_11260 [Synechococcus elongatus PCC 11801]